MKNFGLIGIQNLAQEIVAMRNIDRIDHVILNAGILEYPSVGELPSLTCRFVSDEAASN